MKKNWKIYANCVYLHSVVYIAWDWFCLEKTNQVLWLVTQVSEHVGLGQDAGVDAKVLAQKMAKLSPEVHNILHIHAHRSWILFYFLDILIPKSFCFWKDKQQAGLRASAEGSPVVGSKVCHIYTGICSTIKCFVLKWDTFFVDLLLM